MVPLEEGFVLLTTVEFEGDGVGLGPSSSRDPSTQIVDSGEVDIAGRVDNLCLRVVFVSFQTIDI